MKGESSSLSIAQYLVQEVDLYNFNPAPQSVSHHGKVYKTWLTI